MFSSEQEALKYINQNKVLLLSQLEELEIKTMYTNEHTQISVLKDGKRLLKFINRFAEEKKLVDIYLEMIDLKLF